MNIEVENAIAVIEKEIKAGRIVGLTKWEGRKAKVVILEEAGE